MRCAIVTLGRNIGPEGFPSDDTEDLGVVVSHALDGQSNGPRSVFGGGSVMVPVVFH